LTKTDYPDRCELELKLLSRIENTTLVLRTAERHVSRAEDGLNIAARRIGGRCSIEPSRVHGFRAIPAHFQPCSAQPYSRPMAGRI
jgi:hypothetical protein